MTDLYYRCLNITGELLVSTFIDGLVKYLAEEVVRIKKAGLNIEVKGEICPSCQRGVLCRRKGKNGFFMGCSAYPACKATYSDNRKNHG